MVAAMATAADVSAIEKDLQKAVAGFNGRVGVCIEADGKPACVNGDARFSLQSVVKLMVSMAALDRVDQGKWKMTDKILVTRQDLSVFVQPIAAKVGPMGHEFTLAELMESASMTSDNAACDVLFAKLGGPQAVQAYLTKKGIKSMRVDRDEKTLQTNIIGIPWKIELSDEAVLEKVREATPRDVKAAAYAAYLKDVRDTSTPRAMMTLMSRLQKGEMLSAASTKWLLDVLERTETGPDRLKAGLKPGWRIAHKTGTSSTFEGVAAATNDEGLLYGPKGEIIPIAVFVGDAKEKPEARAAMIAKLARIAVERLGC